MSRCRGLVHKGPVSFTGHCPLPVDWAGPGIMIVVGKCDACKTVWSGVIGEVPQ